MWAGQRAPRRVLTFAVTHHRVGFALAFGPGARNVLDTTKGTFTKDMILASLLPVPLRLREADIARNAESGWPRAGHSAR